MTIAFPRLHILHFDINHRTAAAGWEASNISKNGEGIWKVLEDQILRKAGLCGSSGRVC
ncbi:hypothetical protein PAMP_003503 [Pampus punctatissimus]